MSFAIPVYRFTNDAQTVEKVREYTVLHGSMAGILLGGFGNLPDHYIWRTLAFFCISVHMTAAFCGGFFHVESDRIAYSQKMCSVLFALLAFLFLTETAGAIIATFWFALETGPGAYLAVAIKLPSV
ncbi:hypothetical protein V8F06_007410 [Rhypophila decipiens]